MVGLILLQNSHIILHQIAYQFLLNKVHINQKLSQSCLLYNQTYISFQKQQWQTYLNSW